ncbi:MAG TPA: hypothetical protein VFT22_10865 [Kofleriaceae bacterium]|nr:hypothetical protein [Kofleriaceae bacterium]
MAAGPAPFFLGKHCKFRFFQNAQAVTVDVLKWSVKPNVTKYQDGVNGEDRDRIGRETNFFEGTFECRQVDTSALKALLASQDNDDAGVVPLDQAVGVTVTPPNQNKAAFVGKGVVIDDWEWASEGRTERHRLTIPFRCRYFDQAAVF